VIAPAIKLMRGARHSGYRSACRRTRPLCRKCWPAAMRSWRCTTTRDCRLSSTPAFDRTVNITLGLPILRTSVDHGTALDLAGTGPRPMRAALLAAIELATEIIVRTA